MEKLLKSYLTRRPIVWVVSRGLDISGKIFDKMLEVDGRSVTLCWMIFAEAVCLLYPGSTL